MMWKYLPAACFVFATGVLAQTVANDQSQAIPLTVPAGVPLRLYLTKRVPKRSGAPVEAKLLEGIFAFDREVIPAGAKVLGRVSRLEPVPKFQRARAVLGGDFTPLHRAEIDFTSLQLPDGRQMALKTDESEGLNSIVPLQPPKNKNPKPKSNTGGVLGTGKQKVEDQINARIDLVKSIPGMVRGPNKMERASDYLLAKLPYHPQFVRNGTRFDAELRDPLDFGSEAVTRNSMLRLGSQPAADSVAHARLITPLDSSTSKQGQEVAAVLSAPLFSTDHKLVLPEGTRLNGAVVLAKRARWFHRGGQLRFNFQSVDLPAVAAQLKFPEPAVAPAQTQPQLRFQAILKAAENGQAPLKVDGEGGVKATESKTRFIATAAAILIARRAADADTGRATSGAINGQEPNVAGRTLGGGLGFGMLGAAMAQSSPLVGMALGYYGLAWSVYSTVVARGAEAEFEKNAVIDVGFSALQRPVAAK